MKKIKPDDWKMFLDSVNRDNDLIMEELGVDKIPVVDDVVPVLIKVELEKRNQKENLEENELAGGLKSSLLFKMLSCFDEAGEHRHAEQGYLKLGEVLDRIRKKKFQQSQEQLVEYDREVARLEDALYTGGDKLKDDKQEKPKIKKEQKKLKI